MTRKLPQLCLGIMFLTVMGCSSMQQAGSPPNASGRQRLIDHARAVLAEMSTAKRFPLLDSLLPQSRGVLVYPELTQISVGFGGMKGTGVLFRHERGNSWTPIALCTFEAASAGVQLGISRHSLLVVMMRDDALQYVLHHPIFFNANLFFTYGPGTLRLGRFKPGAPEGIYYFSEANGPFAGVYLENGTIKLLDRLPGGPSENGRPQQRTQSSN